MIDPVTAIKVAQAAVATGQVVAGVIQKSRSNKKGLAETDPTQTMAYNTIKARSRAIRTGTLYSRAVRDLAAGNKTATAGGFKSGFAMRSAINSGLARYNEGVLGLSAIADNAYINNEMTLNTIRTRVEQRKIEVGLLGKKEQEASGTALINSGMENALGSIANADAVGKKSDTKTDKKEVVGALTSLVEGFKQNRAERKWKSTISKVLPDEIIAGDTPESPTDKSYLAPDEPVAGDVQKPQDEIWRGSVVKPDEVVAGEYPTAPAGLLTSLMPQDEETGDILSPADLRKRKK